MRQASTDRGEAQTVRMWKKYTLILQCIQPSKFLSLSSLSDQMQKYAISPVVSIQWCRRHGPARSNLDSARTITAGIQPCAAGSILEALDACQMWVLRLIAPTDSQRGIDAQTNNATRTHSPWGRLRMQILEPGFPFYPRCRSISLTLTLHFR